MSLTFDKVLSNINDFCVAWGEGVFRGRSIFLKSGASRQNHPLLFSHINLAFFHFHFKFFLQCSSEAPYISFIARTCSCHFLYQCSFHRAQHWCNSKRTLLHHHHHHDDHHHHHHQDHHHHHLLFHLGRRGEGCVLG